MYFPYVRGRQYELLALKELSANNLLGKHVIPIIEPVKLSPTLINVIAEYIKKKQSIAIIRNPAVGSFLEDCKGVKENTKEAQYKKKFIDQYLDPSIIKSVIMQKNAPKIVNKWTEQGIKKSDILVINIDRQYLDVYNDIFGVELPKYVLIPDERTFRRKTHYNRVILEDKFEKQNRNADYSDEGFFSEDHLYYRDEGFVGFSDFSVVGNEYMEAGFAPYAVAIHIVYFEKDKTLYVKHFVSNSNEDITNPAKKFYEAVSKLAKWYYSNPSPMNETQGLKALLQHYEDETYPGLGTVKKLSLMHHLELMGNYLDEVN